MIIQSMKFLPIPSSRLLQGTAQRIWTSGFSPVNTFSETLQSLLSDTNNGIVRILAISLLVTVVPNKS